MAEMTVVLWFVIGSFAVLVVVLFSVAVFIWCRKNGQRQNVLEELGAASGFLHSEQDTANAWTTRKDNWQRAIDSDQAHAGYLQSNILHQDLVDQNTTRCKQAADVKAMLLGVEYNNALTQQRISNAQQTAMRNKPENLFERHLFFTFVLIVGAIVLLIKLTNKLGWL
jgi:hypothetical protein